MEGRPARAGAKGSGETLLCAVLGCIQCATPALQGLTTSNRNEASGELGTGGGQGQGHVHVHGHGHARDGPRGGQEVSEENRWRCERGERAGGPEAGTRSEAIWGGVAVPTRTGPFAVQESSDRYPCPNRARGPSQLTGCEAAADAGSVLRKQKDFGLRYSGSLCEAT